MTSIEDFSRDRDWTPPSTNKSALDVTLGAGDSVSFAIRHDSWECYDDEKVDLARQFALPDVIEALWPEECACGEKIKPGEPMRAESYTRLGEPDEWRGRCCL